MLQKVERAFGKSIPFRFWEIYNLVFNIAKKPG